MLDSYNTAPKPRGIIAFEEEEGQNCERVPEHLLRCLAHVSRDRRATRGRHWRDDTTVQFPGHSTS